MSDYIHITGARQHNLKNLDLKIPKHKFVVLTGLSGSGKSSLAFDTVYAEGQRRYVESLSSYARQFLGIMNKPEVDSIDGLSPAISIDQKTTSHNPRSTVGTITEIYDYLRLLFARVGHPHCPNCGRQVSKQSVDQIVSGIFLHINDQLQAQPVTRLLLLSPIVRDKKGEFTSLLDNLRRKGFTHARIDNQIISLDEDIVLLKNNKHTISAVIERISLSQSDQKNESVQAKLKQRLRSALELSLEISGGLAIASFINDQSFDFPKNPQNYKDFLYSEHFACPECNLSLPEIEPRLFSFNSPHGACPTCNGLGNLLKVDPDKIIAPDISISEGAVIPLANVLAKDTWFTRLIATVVEAHDGSMKTPFRQLSTSLQTLLLEGDDPSRTYTVFGANRFGRDTSIEETFPGFIAYLQSKYESSDSDWVKSELSRFMKQALCPQCQGARLKPDALAITIGNTNISEVTNFPISSALDWLNQLDQDHLSSREQEIATLIIKELRSRLKFLLSVGLDYLTLSREAGTLAGGEAQRIRLASQIGTGLTGVLYILDEPTVGLHPRDNQRLISTLHNLRDLGNSVLVVEHDAETMLSSDYLIDFGPGAGKQGGQVVAAGSPQEVLTHPTSLTGKYLSGKKTVTLDRQLKSQVQTLKSPGELVLHGASLHNLKNLDLTIPLGKFICITGVSGSGKSTLMHDTLYHAINRELGRQSPSAQGRYERLDGASLVNKVTLIDQSPIGKTPRSNPATYTKVFDTIRQLFSNTSDAKSRGFKPGRFSFNVKGGRCEACQGDGQVKIEMQFLPDIYVTCEVCGGSRYNAATLEVEYKGKNISQVLDMTVQEALTFFKDNLLKGKIQTMSDVGLDYIKLGQPAPTLSGGEAQRVKLSRELSVRSFGHTLYLLDEPTTGLHFEDVRKLLQVLYRLIAQNNTVIVIEHNLDIIKNAQHIIDLGPEGGDGGGEVIALGTPQEISQNQNSYTGRFLKPLL